MADLNIGPGGSASVFVLHEGYVGRDGDNERVAGTVTLIMDGGAVIVVDPGMVASRQALLSALSAHGPEPGDVTDVVFSHHHPDHTVNAALFPRARIHDHWAVYLGDRWVGRDADGAELGPSVRPLCTPGHTPTSGGSSSTRIPMKSAALAGGASVTYPNCPRPSRLYRRGCARPSC